MILTFLKSPFITKWSLDLQIGSRIFLKSQGLPVRRPSAKIHFENDPQTKKKWETETPSIFVKHATMFNLKKFLSKKFLAQRLHNTWVVQGRWSKIVFVGICKIFDNMCLYLLIFVCICLYLCVFADICLKLVDLVDIC